MVKQWPDTNVGTTPRGSAGRMQEASFYDIMIMTYPVFHWEPIPVVPAFPGGFSTPDI